MAKRGQAVLLMDDGVGAEDIAKLLGVHVRTVFDWKASIAKTADPAAMLASWLNQIECAFSILQAKVLARGSFRSLEELREHVYAFMLWFNAQDAAPFRWSYRPKSWDPS